MSCLAEKIVFPLDNEACLRKARIFFEEDNEDEAVKYIDKAYTLDNNIETNIFYAAVLAHYQRYPEALEIMQLEKEFYMNNEKFATIYTDVLINNQKFLEAEYVIQKYKRDFSSGDPLVWEKFEQTLIQAIETFNFDVSERRDGVIKALGELGRYPSLTQVRKIRDAEMLELSDLQELASYILINSEVDESVRRSFLELLIEKGDKNTYLFLWFDQIKKVCPANVEKFNDVKLVYQLNDLAETKLAKYPDLLVRVKMEMLHDLLLLYPFIEEVISDLNFWLDAYINKLDNFNYFKIEQMAVTEEQKKMMKWIHRQNFVLQRDRTLKED